MRVSPLGLFGRGGDTDANGAIAGALLGAIHGISAVPLQRFDRVLTSGPIDGAPGVETRRPRERPSRGARPW